MKKRILSMALAVALLCSMAVAASAATISLSGPYRSSTYEIYDVCNSYSFTSQTYCDDHSYLLKSDVYEYSIGTLTDENGIEYVAEIMMHYTPGTEAKIASSTSGSTGYLLSKIKCIHYVNGSVVYTSYVNAG